MSDPAKPAKGKAKQLPRGEPLPAPEAVIQRRKDKIRHRRSATAFFIKLISIALVLWLVFTFLFGIGVVEGESMYPRMRDGDLFLYYRLESTYHIGDVVTFTTTAGKRYIGRIVARGGDTVDMSEAGELLVNGNVQDEEIFFPTYKTDAITDFPCTLREDQVFLLSDFRTGGTDSRTYGAVRVDILDGKLITVLSRRNI